MCTFLGEICTSLYQLWPKLAPALSAPLSPLTDRVMPYPDNYPRDELLVLHNQLTNFFMTHYLPSFSRSGLQALSLLLDTSLLA
ncbi:hypothetical protein [Spirosoma agri]|uniref:Uncharacterized protein n=1 Tax=Spirosoma agri TaxID=1987381 RepID=A0A6M0ISL3_9BACT|nr:hypothetical protein [Spirosoma agri]NEU70481.1 hypothetical protein [Spirosoma agri]